MRTLFIVFFALLISISVKANTDWFKMGKTDEAIYSINIRTISQESLYGKQLVKAWIKEEIYNDISKDGLTVGDSTVMHYHSDCTNNKIGLKSSTTYRKGKMLGSSLNNSYVSMKDVIPDSIGESILSYSCEGMNIKQSNGDSY